MGFVEIMLILSYLLVYLLNFHNKCLLSVEKPTLLLRVLKPETHTYFYFWPSRKWLMVVLKTPLYQLTVYHIMTNVIMQITKRQ